MPGVIRVSKLHTHTISSAQALRYLQDQSGREQFFEYFSDSMTVPEAKRYHEGCLEVEGRSEEDLANTRINPSLRTINYWHDLWRELNLDPRFGSGVFKVNFL